MSIDTPHLDTHELAMLRQRISDLEQELGHRRHVERTLHQQIDRLELVLQGTQDGFWDFDVSSGSVYFSPSWRRMFGYREDEEPGGLDQWRERIHPDDRTRVIDALEAYMAGEADRYLMEYRLRHRDGSYRWIMARAAAVRDATGRAVRLAGTHTDTTEHRHLERERHAESELMRLILRSAPIILFAVDREGTITFLDGQFLRTIGMTPEMLLGKSIYKAYAHATKTLDSVRRALDGEEVRWTESLTVYISDNLAVPLRDETGAVIGMIAICFNVTEERKAITDLRISQERLRALLDHMPIALFMLDRNARITFLDGKALESLEHPPSSLIGQPVTALMQHSPEASEHIAAVLQGEERTWYSTAGARTFEVRAVPLRDEGGQPNGLLGIASDSTARVRAEAERARLQEAIISAQEAALAELSTPLIPISDRVLVMPLIGNLDPRRAQQVLDTLLNGIAQSHANVVILDITGVPVVDTQVANTLLQAAQAVQLLGARVVLTGIRPEVAQTLVGLGLDLGQVVTRSSLQSGITYALGGDVRLTLGAQRSRLVSR